MIGALSSEVKNVPRLRFSMLAPGRQKSTRWILSALPAGRWASFFDTKRLLPPRAPSAELLQRE
ncbi:MAG: hypothetical protein DME26_20245 [Verrucomicrobia bacterium]|nr:MAG: hypothetical protein DME26_20245 [Verrucomicrobiota bacterium]